MRPVVKLGFGPLFATLAAGPVFGCCLLVANYLRQIPNAVPISSEDILMIGVMAIPFFIGGIIISVLPNMLGALALGMIAERSPFFQAPAIWGLVGCIIIALPFAGAYGGGANFDNDVFAFAGSLAMTATLCAFICRHFAVWEVAQDPKAVLLRSVTLRNSDPDPRLLR